jgi:hypothetical protein
LFVFVFPKLSDQLFYACRNVVEVHVNNKNED